MKKEMKTQQTKEKILKAAIQEFGTNGYEGATVNNICSAGIAKGLLYHNYANKDEIYLACVARCFAMVTECLENQEIGTDIELYMKVRLEFFQNHEKESHIFFESILQPPNLLKEQIKDIQKDFDMYNRELYRKVIGKLQLRADIDEGDAMWYFRLFQDMFNGYFSSPALCGLEYPENMNRHEEVLSKIFDFMLYGIAERSVKND